jgi:hypothetical protein
LPLMVEFVMRIPLMLNFTPPPASAPPGVLLALMVEFLIVSAPFSTLMTSSSPTNSR